MNTNELKIIMSQNTWLYIDDIQTKSIENLDSMKVSANLWGWQWEIDFEIKTNYGNLNYADNNLIEIAIYNDDNKLWKLIYSWFIKNINRNYNQTNWDSLEIEILGIWSLLWEYEWTFVFSWALDSCITSFINSFHWVYNISNEMEFLWNNILKNWVTNTISVSINKTWKFFDILKWIFDSINKTFFIDNDWTIYLWDSSEIEHILWINENIIDLQISSTRETQIELSENNFNIKPGDKIFIQNINQSFNMDWSRIEKVEFWLLNTKIYLWEIWSLWTTILKV